MVVLVAHPKKTVDLVDEYDAGLDFGGEREDRPGQLLGLAVPLVREGGYVQVQESGTSFSV